jgi:tetratricopeptide (TPR) repeat protein
MRMNSTRLLLAACLLAIPMSGCASAPETPGKAERGAVGAAASAGPEATTTPAAAAAPRTAAEAMAEGDAAWRAGEIEKALYMFVQAQQLDEQSETPLLRIGAIQESRGKHELARQAFAMAVERAPANAAAHERLGFQWLRSGEHDRAAAAFTEAARIDSTRWRSCMGLGLAAERRRDLQAARVHYDAAFALRPRSAELLVHSARVRMLTGDLPGALAEARASLDIGSSESAWLAIGDITARMGDFPGGLEAYHKVLPGSAAYFRLGEQAMAAMDYERAMDYFEQAAAAAPSYYEEAHKSLAVARERLADQRRASGAAGRVSPAVVSTSAQL